MTNFMNVLGAKRLELVSEAVPTAVVLGLLVNPTNPNAEADTRDLQAAAQALGRRLQVLTAGTDRQLETAFATAVEQKVGALFINIDSFLFDRRQQIAALAALGRILRGAKPADLPVLQPT